MLNIAQRWLENAQPVAITAMTLLALIAAGLAWFHPRHGSAASGFGKLIGLVVFLAIIAVLPTLIGLAQQDVTTGGGGGVPAAPAAPAEVGN